MKIDPGHKAPHAGNAVEHEKQSHSAKNATDDYDKETHPEAVATPPTGGFEVGQRAEATLSLTAAAGATFRDLWGENNFVPAIAGVVSRLLGMTLPGPGTIYMGQTFDVGKPLEVGDEITVTMEITKKRDDKHMAFLDTRCVNQRGEVVLSGQAVVKLPRSSVARSGAAEKLSSARAIDPPAIEAEQSDNQLTVKFTRAMVDAFAQVSGDENPVHMDEAFAATTPFGRCLAHGSLVASMIHRLVDGHGSLSRFETRFTAPVFIGDTITARLQPPDDSGLNVIWENQRGDTVIQGKAAFG